MTQMGLGLLMRGPHMRMVLNDLEGGILSIGAGFSAERLVSVAIARRAFRAEGVACPPMSSVAASCLNGNDVGDDRVDPRLDDRLVRPFLREPEDIAPDGHVARAVRGYVATIDDAAQLRDWDDAPVGNVV